MARGRRNQQNANGGANQGAEGNQGDGANTSGNQGNQSNDGENTNQNRGNQANQRNKGTIILGVYLHCEECAKKVAKCLTSFDGVEDVKTDCKEHKVTIKGKNDVDPKKVAERVWRECNSKKVVIISPKMDEKNAKKGSHANDSKKEQSKDVTVTVKMYIHCDNCGKEIKKSIQKMEGVKTAEIDTKNSQITVKGDIKAENVIKYIDKKMGKQASIVRAKKQQQTGGQNRSEPSNQDNSEAVNRQRPLYSPVEYPELIYASEMFSDENPLACIIM